MRDTAIVRTGMTRVRAIGLPAAILAIVAVACGDRAPAGDPSRDDVPTRYRATATVIDDAKRGPVLCVGGVAESLPPQCGGVPLDGWDWDLVEGEESRSGERWGDFTVEGTYDGERFTVLSAGPAEPPPPEPPIDWTACDEPAGGWPIPDPSLVSEDDLVATMQAARHRDGFAGFWIDQGGGPGGVTIVNVAFTGDLEVHEAEIRETWGGPICMIEHARTEAELRRVQRELSDPAIAEELGIQATWSATNVLENHVEQGVIVATDEARAAIVERYGEGAVELFPALIPTADG